MTDKTTKYTHVGILKRTQKQIALLAKVANGGQGVDIYKLVESWAEAAWAEAKEAGLVTDEMIPAGLQAHWIGVDPASADSKTVTVVSIETSGKAPRRRTQMLGRDR